MKTCPLCGVRMDDERSHCPACGADYAEALVNDIAPESSRDAELLLENLEETLRPLQQAPQPTPGETARKLLPQLCGAALLLCLAAGLATGANIFYLLAAAALAGVVAGLVRKPMGRGEVIVRAAARVFDEDAASLRKQFADRPDLSERIDALRQRLDEALALQAEAHRRNGRTIRIAAAVVLVAAAAGIGVLAVRNHAARKAAEEYALQPEWVKLRDACLASADDEYGDHSERLAVLRAMLDAGVCAEAEAFFFDRCQGRMGDADCALLIAKHYRDNGLGEALAAFADKVSLRYDSDTQRIRSLKR